MYRSLESDRIVGTSRPLQRRIGERFPAVLFLLFILSPGTSTAMEQTDKCHCFRDRSFNPAKRFQADDYLLTTVGNSLTASHFGISKRHIVMMKMEGGTGNDDLLIGLYLGSFGGSGADDYLSAKGETSWQKVVAGDAMLDGRRDDAILNFLRKGESEGKAAGLIMEAMLRKRFGVSDEALLALAGRGLLPREKALVLTLAEHVGVPPEKIAAQNRTAGRSWSEIAHNFGLEPARVGKLVLSTPAKPLER
jgi:hypothetical protein